MNNLQSLALRLQDSRLYILDQQALPHQELWLRMDTVDQLVTAIQALKVRGAPLIAVSACLMLAVMAKGGASRQALLAAEAQLRASRPTAVNLMNALDRCLTSLNDPAWIPQNMVTLAEGIFLEDQLLCQRIAEHGADLILDGDGILTHCNTGGLATAGLGTALGCIVRAHQQGKSVHVWVDETRPLLQGGRLTTWELAHWGVPFTLVTDSMAAYLMVEKKINKVFVGADRIALNGDFANKIGTYGLAVAAQYHDVDFYVAAPYTTIDPACPSGDHIPIEQRDPREVRGVHTAGLDCCWSLKGCESYNPAFDVTPGHLVSGLILDTGVVSRDQLTKHLSEYACKTRI